MNVPQFLACLLSCILFGIATAGCLWGLWVSVKTYRWPATEGRIVESRVRRVTRRGYTWYEPTIAFVYHVNSRVYRSRRIYITGNAYYRWQCWAQWLLRHYLKKEHIVVRYNP